MKTLTQGLANMNTLCALLVGILLSLSGCQTGHSLQTAAIDNGKFMDLWNTYSHCHTTNDIIQLSEDATILTSAADRALTKGAWVLPLPVKLEQFVSTPAARFAVDVKAMAAACSLRAGSVAAAAGQLDLAKDLLQTVLSYQPQSEYAYYSMRAKSLLSELEEDVVQVTLNIP